MINRYTLTYWLYLHSSIYRWWFRRKIRKVNKQLVARNAGHIYAPWILTENVKTICNGNLPTKSMFVSSRYALADVSNKFYTFEIE